MKTLYLVRHAKSSWDYPGLSDFNRPLMPTGLNKTRKIINYLKKKKISVDLIISSPAVRALETARMVANGLDYPEENIKTESAIYEGRVNEFLDVICETPDKFNSLMIFGHNPTISYVANSFLDQGFELLPTTGVVAISFDTEHWKEIQSVRPVQQFVIFPKMLKS
jgi:phosphohistidine phosphatase